VSVFYQNRQLGVGELPICYNVVIAQMLGQFDSYIKVVADLKERKLAGGGEFHVDCEQQLIEQGSKQSDLWGGGVDWLSKTVEFNSMTNIKPRDNNPSQEILDPKIRKEFEILVKELFEIKD